MAILFTWLRNFSTGDPIPSNQIKYSSDDADLASVKEMIDSKTSIDTVYPVGSIYMSVNSTNPGDLFGGTWEQIQDRFLLSAGSTYTADTTGGASTHTLTVNEMPAHNHLAGVQTAQSESAGYSLYYSPSGGFVNRGIVIPGSDAARNVYTSNRGAGEAFSTLPPYLVVYMFKRTA